MLWKREDKVNYYQEKNIRSQSAHFHVLLLCQAEVVIIIYLQPGRNQEYGTFRGDG